MYKVDISPSAKEVLDEYTFRCNQDNGIDCALRLLDSYDEKISFLEQQPYIGCARLKYIPVKYRVISFWPHLWFVYQINEERKHVIIDYIIDDRQNYGAFLK